MVPHQRTSYAASNTGLTAAWTGTVELKPTMAFALYGPAINNTLYRRRPYIDNAGSLGNVVPARTTAGRPLTLTGAGRGPAVVFTTRPWAAVLLNDVTVTVTSDVSNSTYTIQAELYTTSGGLPDAPVRGAHPITADVYTFSRLAVNGSANVTFTVAGRDFHATGRRDHSTWPPLPPATTFALVFSANTLTGTPRLTIAPEFSGVTYAPLPSTNTIAPASGAFQVNGYSDTTLNAGAIINTSVPALIVRGRPYQNATGDLPMLLAPLLPVADAFSLPAAVVYRVQRGTMRLPSSLTIMLTAPSAAGSINGDVTLSISTSAVGQTTLLPSVSFSSRNPPQRVTVPAPSAGSFVSATIVIPPLVWGHFGAGDFSLIVSCTGSTGTASCANLRIATLSSTDSRAASSQDQVYQLGVSASAGTAWAAVDMTKHAAVAWLWETVVAANRANLTGSVVADTTANGVGLIGSHDNALRLWNGTQVHTMFEVLPDPTTGAARTLQLDAITFHVMNSRNVPVVKTASFAFTLCISVVNPRTLVSVPAFGSRCDTRTFGPFMSFNNISASAPEAIGSGTALTFLNTGVPPLSSSSGMAYMLSLTFPGNNPGYLSMLSGLPSMSSYSAGARILPGCWMTQSNKIVPVNLANATSSGGLGVPFFPSVRLDGSLMPEVLDTTMQWRALASRAAAAHLSRAVRVSGTATSSAAQVFVTDAEGPLRLTNVSVALQFVTAATSAQLLTLSLTTVLPNGLPSTTALASVAINTGVYAANARAAFTFAVPQTWPLLLPNTRYALDVRSSLTSTTATLWLYGSFASSRSSPLRPLHIAHRASNVYNAVPVRDAVLSMMVFAQPVALVAVDNANFMENPRHARVSSLSGPTLHDSFGSAVLFTTSVGTSGFPRSVVPTAVTVGVSGTGWGSAVLAASLWSVDQTTMQPIAALPGATAYSSRLFFSSTTISNQTVTFQFEANTTAMFIPRNSAPWPPLLSGVTYAVVFTVQPSSSSEAAGTPLTVRMLSPQQGVSTVFGAATYAGSAFRVLGTSNCQASSATRPSFGSTPAVVAGCSSWSSTASTNQPVAMQLLGSPLGVAADPSLGTVTASANAADGIELSPASVAAAITLRVTNVDGAPVAPGRVFALIHARKVGIYRLSLSFALSNATSLLPSVALMTARAVVADVEVFADGTTQLVTFDAGTTQGSWPTLISGQTYSMVLGCERGCAAVGGVLPLVWLGTGSSNDADALRRLTGYAAGLPLQLLSAFTPSSGAASWVSSSVMPSFVLLTASAAPATVPVEMPVLVDGTIGGTHGGPVLASGPLTSSAAAIFTVHAGRPLIIRNISALIMSTNTTGISPITCSVGLVVAQSNRTFGRLMPSVPFVASAAGTTGTAVVAETHLLPSLSDRASGPFQLWWTVNGWPVLPPGENFGLNITCSNPGVQILSATPHGSGSGTPGRVTSAATYQGAAVFSPMTSRGWWTRPSDTFAAVRAASPSTLMSEIAGSVPLGTADAAPALSVHGRRAFLFFDNSNYLSSYWRTTLGYLTINRYLGLTVVLRTDPRDFSRVTDIQIPVTSDYNGQVLTATLTATGTTAAGVPLATAIPGVDRVLTSVVNYGKTVSGTNYVLHFDTSHWPALPPNLMIALTFYSASRLY